MSSALSQAMELGSIMSNGQPLTGSPTMIPQHTTAAIFHVLFKAIAVLVYFFSGFFSNNFILIFVLCVLSLAFDFWTVKNVTGRLMVGLRWWSEVKEDGSTTWNFESKPEHVMVHPSDSLVFWIGLYAAPLIWLIFGFSAMFHPQWLLIVGVALILSSANVVGYWKCQTDAKKRIQMFIARRL